MKIKISMQNEGGELDHRIAEDDTVAVIVFAEMIQELGSLNPGDKFIITEVE